MDSNTPGSYKNYLPSKKIQLVIAILLGILAAYFLVPKLYTLIKEVSIPKVPTSNLSVTLPTGDPTTRDSDGDGVLDWQEIAVGLDPQNPVTKNGTPDMQTFETLKAQVGVALFANEEAQVTDTDKVSLTIYDTLAKDSIENNGIAIDTTQAVTGQELINYITAQRARIKTFSQKDLSVVQGTMENNEAYAKAMKPILADTPETKNAPKLIAAYLDGTADRSKILPFVNALKKKITPLQTVPVPSSAASIHLEILNAFQGIAQVLDEYDHTNTDPTSKISATSLVQDYLMIATRSNGLLSIYLSVALDSNGYAQ